MRRHALALLVLWSPLALAQGMEGVGRISLHPGWRWTPNGFFAESAESLGHPLERSSPGGPHLTASFAYAASGSIEVAIDLFGGVETLRPQGLEEVTSVSYGALVGARAFWALGDLIPYVGLSLGPVLVNTTGGADSGSTERLTTGYVGTVGATWRLSDTFGLTADARWLIARGMASGLGGLNAGGLWAGVGATWYFAADAGRPGAIP